MTDELKRKIASAENMAVRQRNYRRARDRALARLAQAHRGEYLELLAKEKEADEQEGKRWRNLTGPDVSTDLDYSTNRTSKTRGDTSVNTQNESDNE